MHKHIHVHMRMPCTHMHTAGPPTSGGACTACILHVAACTLRHIHLTPSVQCVYRVWLYLPWQALGLTASVTCALTVYALRSKRDFSFMGAGCVGRYREI